MYELPKFRTRNAYLLCTTTHTHKSIQNPLETGCCVILKLNSFSSKSLRCTYSNYTHQDSGVLSHLSYKHMRQIEGQIYYFIHFIIYCIVKSQAENVDGVGKGEEELQRNGQCKNYKRNISYIHVDNEFRKLKRRNNCDKLNNVK